MEPRTIPEGATQRIVAEQGSRVVANTPDEFAAFIRSEQEEIAALAKAAGAKVE